MGELAIQPTRDALKDLQEKIVACGSDGSELPVTHHFADGVYGREIFIPKGVLVAGRIHKTEHISIISHGMVDVVVDYLETGKVETVTYVAPCTFISPPGTKRMVLAQEDTIWTTFHRHTGPRDEDAMIDIMSWKTYDDFESDNLLASHCQAPEIEVKS